MYQFRSLGEMFKLYLGGYKPQKILRCSLDILLEKQNHTEEGKEVLRKLWPVLVETALELDLSDAAHAYERAEEMMEAAANTKCKLLDLIKTQDWSGGYHQPVILND